MKLIKYIAWGLLIFGCQLSHAEETEADKLRAVQKINLGGRPLIMVGMGLTQLMNDDYYIGAFYIDEAAQYSAAEDLADFDANRRMEFRFASERKVSARGFARKIAEGIRINNASANVKSENDKLRRLFKLFAGSYKKGDIICLEYYANSGSTKVRQNGRIIGEIERSRDLYRLLVKTWVGERPPSSLFREGISGKNENTYAIALLKRFIAL